MSIPSAFLLGTHHSVCVTLAHEVQGGTAHQSSAANPGSDCAQWATSRTTFEWTRVQLLDIVIVRSVVPATGEVEFALAQFLVQWTAGIVDAGLVTLQAVALMNRM